MKMLHMMSALTVLAGGGSALAITTYAPAVHAQTQGMERRDDRRDTRQTSRDVKQECKAGDEKSHAECRHTKHEVKQSGRQGETPQANSANPEASAPK